MSDASRQRILRAVRLLPTAVKLGRGGIEEDAPDQGASSAPREDESPDRTELIAAEAEIRKLKGEMREYELAANEAREDAKAARAELESVRAASEASAKELLERVEREKGEALKAASEKGYADGSESGYSDGLKRAEEEISAEYEKRFADALALLDGMAKSLSDDREKLVATHAPEMIRLWQIMLERMLQAHLKIDEGSVNRMLEAILRRVSDRERVMVYLNPADMAMVESGKEHLIDQIRGVRSFELLSDEHVDKGSCLVETNLGIYDARWRTQIEQISQEVETLLAECILMEPTNA